MHRKEVRRIVLASAVLYVIFFAYRFAFRSDFQALQLLEMVLNALSDTIVSLILFVTLTSGTQWIRKRIRFNTPALVVSIACTILFYALAVVLLRELHRFVYEVTTGFSEKFTKTFYSTAYQVFDSYLVVAFGLALLTAYSIYTRWVYERIERERAQRERIDAELRFLKAQINPHFVFNTLNNIHFLIDESNSDARKLLRDFCDLLRYQLYDTGKETIELAKELEYLENYIRIQKIRKEEGFSVDLQNLVEAPVQIAPMLLIIPVENAFKYSPSDAGGWIRIRISFEKCCLEFEVENNYRSGFVHSDNAGGLGLTNLRKRLDLIYGTNATFEYQETDNVVRTLLRIREIE